MNTELAYNARQFTLEGWKKHGLCLTLYHVPDGIAGINARFDENRVLFEWWARDGSAQDAMNVYIKKLKESILHDD